eukprot:scaffold71840_cov53-Phaeocystis_antarctica.AAC.1
MPSRGTAEACGGPRAAAVELRHGLGAEAAAVEGAPPLQGAGVADVLPSVAVEARGGPRAAAVELRHWRGAGAGEAAEASGGLRAAA